MRAIARFIVGLLALFAILRTCLAACVTFKVIRTPNADGNVISYSLGFLVGSALFVALFVWLFRKLAPRDDLA